MWRSSQALLDLENKNPSSSKDSALLVCESDDLFRFKSTTNGSSQPPQTKPPISSVPKSQVFGKLKDFLGVISESNKKLQLDAMNKSEDYNIEVLTGNESDIIEMDLMLGVADLHTPEAVAAAESAIAGNQQVIPLAASCGSSSGEESEDSSEEDDSDNTDNDENEDDDTSSPTKVRRKALEDGSSDNKVLKKCRTKKRPKIVELS